MLDVVYNHLGPDGNYLGRFGPYFTDRYRTPWGAGRQLRRRRAATRCAASSSTTPCMWLRDYHVDGLRLDAVHAIVDTSAVHVLEQLAAEVDDLAAAARPARLRSSPRATSTTRASSARREAGGYGLDAQWSDDFHHALHAVLTGERDGYYADFGRSADLADGAATGVSSTTAATRRTATARHGRPPTGLPGDALRRLPQNHDQVGNRAAGERLSAPRRRRPAARSPPRSS